MLEKIEHIGIAVKDLDKTIQFYRDILKLNIIHTEEVLNAGYKIAFFQIGEVQIELLQGTKEDSVISKFIEKRGEGIHHICYEVKNIYEALEYLKSSGVELVNEKPVAGSRGSLIAFLHPKSTSGVLIELCQKN